MKNVPTAEFFKLVHELEGYIEGGDKEDLYHDDETMHKIYRAIMDKGLSGDLAHELVTAIQNAGILFRERPR